jgi:nitroimidazol reductase NimA-like FMN-containing flavoprotein (pyridoxamine 5'-phosphate oxidase superfamily)
MQPSPSHLVPSRSAKRASYDSETIHSILDEALFCTISYCVENRPFSIPTSFVRYDDKIYVHGSVGSHFIREIEKGIPVCITVMLADSLVVAKSAFSHSVNYRSVIIFSNAEKVEEREMKIASFEWLTNKMVPESWDYLRPVKESEVRKTSVLSFSLENASAKTRSGMPNDEPEDKELPIWSGIIPLNSSRMPAIPDDTSESILLPKHLR